MLPTAIKNPSTRGVVHKSTGGMCRAIPEPVDPCGQHCAPALKCVTHVLAHPLPMSPVHTAATREGPASALSAASGILRAPDTRENDRERIANLMVYLKYSPIAASGVLRRCYR